MLQQHVEVSLHDQERQLVSTRDKVVWCVDVTGDRHGVEAKLDAADKLMNSIDALESKRTEASQNLEQLKAVFDSDVQCQLEERIRTNIDQWTAMLYDLQKARFLHFLIRFTVYLASVTDFHH